MPADIQQPRSPRTRRRVVLCAAVVLGAVYLWNAWVCDDAYISFRVVDNAVHGYGLRWNVQERVQPYTHPLWMLLHIPVYWALGNIYATTLLLSLAASMGAVVLALRLAADRPWLAVGAVAVPLGVVQPFVLYTTGGLENPLTFLCVAAFATLLCRADPAAPPIVRLGLAAGLAMLTRLDTALLYAPALAWLAWRYRGRRALRRLLPGAGLVAAWELFSLFYYGAPFPNTSYAKLGTGIPHAAYLRQGLRYAGDLLVRHPDGALLMLLAVGSAALAARPRRRGCGAPDTPALVLALGLCAYCAYIVWIGGDFMTGRFWAAPIFVAVLVLARRLPAVVPPVRDGAVAAGLAAAVIGLRLAAPLRPIVDTLTIVNEREYYAATNSLRNLRPGNGPAQFRESQLALHARAEARLRRATGHADGYILRTGSVGMAGFYGGPDVIVLDPLALGDPLLARLPVADPVEWRIGHFIREVPQGYEHALRTGALDRMAPSLRAYYAVIRLITRGPLWSPARLRAIVAFNLERYDHVRDAFLRPRDLPPRPLAGLATPVPPDTPWDAPGAVRLPPHSRLPLTVEPPRVADEIEIAAEAFGRYRIVLYSGSRAVATLMLEPAPDEVYTQVFVTRTLPVPSEARGVPLDRITVEPRGGREPIGGNGRYSIAYVALR